MKPEEKARQEIDQLLELAGWKVQDYRELNLGASLGVAVREFPLKSRTADYLLFVDRKPAGVIEANNLERGCRTNRKIYFDMKKAFLKLSLMPVCLRRRKARKSILTI